MSIDRYVPSSNNDSDPDWLEKIGLTQEEVNSRLVDVAYYYSMTEINTDENGRSLDCDYPAEVGLNGEPLNDL